MAALFITGTGTDIGKTYVTAGLIRALRASGRAVEVLKPVVSGFDPQAPDGSDPAVLLEALGMTWSAEALEHISPWQFLAPLSPPLAANREGRALDRAEVIALCRDRIIRAEDRLLLIEGAGGVMSPLDDDHTMLDLARALQIPVLLVSGSYLGTISHTLTAALALRSTGVEMLAVVISESVDGPPLDETVQILRRFLHDVPVITIRRGEAAPTDLLRRIAAVLS
jgi:dethiobiotin synthetase